MIRGIRGATTVSGDSASEILEKTQNLLLKMVEVNAVNPEDISSICFTMTPDLHATFPAEAARRIGWKYVPVICMREINVPGALAQTIRVLMQAETDLAQHAVEHVYLEKAVVLREDLVSKDARES